MRGFVIGAICLIALAVHSSAVFAATFQRLVLAGEPAPGPTPNTTFSSFELPRIDATGNVLFRATDNLQREGIWVHRDGRLEKVARRGEATPGRTGTFIGIDQNLSMNASGQIAFGALWSNPTLSGSAIWTGTPGALTIAVADEDPVPGLPGVRFDGFFHNRRPALDSGGQIAFSASLASNFGTVNSTNDSGVWKWASGTLSKVLRAGDAAPGTEAGVTFGSFDSFNPLRMSNGNVVVRASLVGPGITDANNSGLWLGDGQSLTRIVRDGDPAPSGEQFRDVAFDEASRPVLAVSDVGDMVFRSRLASGHHGIYRARDGFIQTIVRSGDPAPGTGGTFLTVHSPMVTSSGLVAFWATQGAISSPQASLWTWSNGTLKKIISSDEIPAQMPAGFEFLRLGGTGQSPALLLLNDNGQMAFGSSVRNIVSGASYSTLWGYDPASGVQLLVGPLQTLEIAPGDVRSISPRIFVDTQTIDGRFNSLNSSGQLAVDLSWNFGGGIFVTTIPEPASIAIVAVAAATLISRRRRFPSLTRSSN